MHGRPGVLSLLGLVALLASACGSSGAGDPATAAAPSPAVAEVVPTSTAEPSPTVTPSPRPTPTPLPTPTPRPPCVAEVPLRVALGQLLLTLAAPDQFTMLDELAGTGSVSGVVILGSPTEADLGRIPRTDATGVPVLLTSDEEGGRVQRLAPLLGPLPPAAQLVAEATASVESTFAAYGEGLRSLGVNVAFAPVVDVGGGPGIGNRSFSDDPAVVATYAGAVVDGYLAAGVLPVIKHFPGHGRASADSHLSFATTPPIDELRASDLLPFKELAGEDVGVMVGHLLVPGLTEDLPASLSPAAVDGLLRDELGFDGLVVSDDLGMNAIADRWDNAEAAQHAVSAGVDLVILQGPEQVVPVLDHLAAAVVGGTLDREQVDDSLERVLAYKNVDPCDLRG